MSAVASVANAVSPIGDHSRLRRIGKAVAWIVAAMLVFVALDAFGVDIGGWIGGLWDTLGSVSFPYLIAAIAVVALRSDATSPEPSVRGEAT